MGSFSQNSGIKQLNHDVYDERNRHYLRQVSTTDPPDEVTEFLNDMETTTSAESITGSFNNAEDSTTTEMSTFMEYVDETQSTVVETTLQDAMKSDSSPESNQTILIVLGILLAILVTVCCVLACIFAKLRRKGFCKVEGKNQATCDDDCQEDAISLQQSPKESMTSGKSGNSRSSDKLLTK